MLHVKCYLSESYLFTHVVCLLQQYGLQVESVGPEGEKDRDWRKMWVVGHIKREQAADLWNVRGLLFMMDLK